MRSVSTVKTAEALRSISLDPFVLELLASRICHDLISPVGAVHNGVEFLEEMGVAAGEEAVGLIAHSAAMAAAKLQIFRLAYGAGGRDPNIKPDDVYKAFGNLVDADAKIKQDWDPHGIDRDAFPDGFCKMLTGGMMLAQESLPKGGTIRVEQPDAKAIHVIAEGPDAAPRSQFREALERSIAPADLDPRLVHPYTLSVLAEQYGFVYTIRGQEDNRVTYRLEVR